ncbi:MAG TPA: hypothetical protein VHC70_02355, partial [Phycisphaerales bacterium]|nr:hypothetical protein [Phycisphaerales bacterium]
RVPPLNPNDEQVALFSKAPSHCSPGSIWPFPQGAAGPVGAEASNPAASKGGTSMPAAPSTTGGRTVAAV